MAKGQGWTVKRLSDGRWLTWNQWDVVWDKSGPGLYPERAMAERDAKLMGCTLDQVEIEFQDDSSRR